MRIFLVLPIYQLLQIARGQLKTCYDWDGTATLDYPCDPSANVSACCGAGGRCVTNFFCVTALNSQIVGTCTDKSWANDACPWVLNKSTAALNFDHFKYSLNTTSCPDNTICPGPQNQSCCDAQKGKKEVDFDNNAMIPKDMKDLTSYYQAAGYTIPSRAAESSTSESSASGSSRSGSSRSGSTAQRTPSSLLLSSTQDVDPSISTSTSVSRPSSISSDQASGGSGLSISAKAIVGAAASIAALLLLVSCLYLIHRRRLKYRAVNLVRSAEPGGAENGREVEMRRNVSELQGSPTAVEMDETNPK